MNIQAISTEPLTFSSDSFRENSSQLKNLDFSTVINSTVTQIIRDLGVPAHVKGYCYLRSAIIMATENYELNYAITKELYPAIAKKYNTTPQRVERDIRHAVELAWDTGDMETLSQYFGYRIKKSFDKPTNSEVIANISDSVRIRLNLEQ